jgi:hypothetical protein
MDKLRWNWNRAAFVLLAIVASGQSGCLLVAAGAAGGAAAGYAYYNGRVCQSFVANFEDAWAASHTALGELGMPILKEERQTACGVIKTQTSDGDRIRIALDVIPSRIPAEGSLTRICVRVATFGDHPVSERILYQVGAHLVASQFMVRPPESPPMQVPPVPQTQNPTSEPPLTSPPAASQKAPPVTPPLLPPEPRRAE